MAFTQAQINQFEQSLADRGGVVSATFADQNVTFTSYDDALKFLAQMKRDIAGGSITRYVATDKDV